MEEGLKTADPHDCSAYTGWTGEVVPSVFRSGTVVYTPQLWNFVLFLKWWRLYPWSLDSFIMSCFIVFFLKKYCLKVWSLTCSIFLQHTLYIAIQMCGNKRPTYDLLCWFWLVVTFSVLTSFDEIASLVSFINDNLVCYV